MPSPPKPAADVLWSFSDALDLVLRACEAIRPGTPETVPLVEAHTRVLAETIHADRDQPPFDRSTRDGFAVHLELQAAPALSARGAPSPSAPVFSISDPWNTPKGGDVTESTWQVVGELFAGQTWRGRPLHSGEALEIMTGAPVPEGASAVVMVEHVLDSAVVGAPPPSGSVAPAACNAANAVPRTIALAPGRTITPGANIVPRGREATTGSALLSPGMALGPAEIALAASAGAATVAVFPRPSVAIISTGDELVELGDPAVPALAPHQIRNSNSYALAALVAEAGGRPWRLPIARDTRESLVALLEQARAQANLILLTGGVSMGRHDLVEEVLLSLGAIFHFTGVRMQPGKPVVFGSLPSLALPAPSAAGPSVPGSNANPDAPGPDPRTQVPAADSPAAIPLFGLPGNPISTEVTFRCFVAPILRALGGEARPVPRFASARLAGEIAVNPAVTRLLPARLEPLTANGSPDVRVGLVPWQGSGDLASNARANCYALLDANRAALHAGDIVPVLLR